MRLDPNPLFRRIIMPWYDSTPLCWCLLAAMLALVIFSLAGVSVARENPGYRDYAWVPWSLLVLSLYVCLSVAVRLIRRHLPHRDVEP